jgi:cyanate permease
MDLKMNQNFNPISTNSRWIVLVISWLVYFALGLLIGSLPPLVTSISSDLDLTNTQMGLILGSGMLMYITLSLPVGMLVDRIGLKRMISIGTALVALSGLLRYFAINFETMFLAVFLIGFGGPIISIGLAKVIACSFQGNERGLASGIYMTGVFVGLATALTITNSVIIPIVSNWRIAFVVFGVIGFITLIIWIILMKDFEKDDELDNLVIPMKDVLRKIIKLKNVWLVAIITSAYFFAAYGLGNWLPTLLESKGMSSVEAGVFASLPIWMGILSSGFLPKFAKPDRRKTMMALLVLIQGLMVYSVAITSGIILTGSLIVLGLCTYSIIPILLLMLMDITEIGAEYMGIASGILFSIGNVFAVISPLLVGYIFDFTGSLTPSILILSVMIECVLIFIFLLKE